MLEGWSPNGGMLSLEWLHLARLSNFATLPYAGGWAEQPSWWLDDLSSLMLLEELIELRLADERQEAMKPKVTMDDIQRGWDEL